MYDGMLLSENSGSAFTGMGGRYEKEYLDMDAGNMFV